MNTKLQKMLYLIYCLNLLLTESNDFLGLFMLHKEKEYVLSGPRKSSLIFASQLLTVCRCRLYSFILRIKLYDLKTEVNQDKVKLRIK